MSRANSGRMNRVCKAIVSGCEICGLAARRWLPAALLLASLAFAQAAERFPPPEFESHHLPVTTVPPPRAMSLDYLDVAVLAAALSLAAWLALRRRSRAGIVALSVLSLAYLGFWRKGCVCPVGATQNVALALWDTSYAIPFVVVAFFFLPLIFALLFGRVFCAAVCPLGTTQDLVAWKPLRVPRWLDRPRRMLPVAYLGLAILSAATGCAFVVCQYDPFVSFFRRSGPVPILLLGAGFLVAGVFVARPYCRYLCPYGVLLGWLSRLSRWRVTITPDECIQCRLCEDACPFDAIEKPTPDWTGTRRSAGRAALVVALLLLPVLAAGGGWLGSRMSAPLSRLHRTVQLAERVWLENAGKVEGTTLASTTFRLTGRPEDGLYAEAREVQRRFAAGAPILGAFIGAVLGGAFVQLSLRRRRKDYEPDRAACLSCARCFHNCPRERLRLKRKGSGAA